MSGHTYIKDTSNLFDDDIDDATFVSSYRSKFPPAQPKPTAPSYGGGHLGELERQRQAMLERQREIEQRTIDSSSRSVGLLRETENIGIATAEELAHQRQQLENTNKRLDSISNNLNTSQKHLNGIKSMFYGLKNYIAGKSDKTPPRSQMSPETSTSRSQPSTHLENTLNDLSSTSNPENRFDSHPSTRLRGLGETTVPDSKKVNELLDANLDEMLHTITRLKGLGVALAEEIDDQNELIDTIQEKVEGADIKIGSQTKQMNKLLGK